MMPGITHKQKKNILDFTRKVQEEMKTLTIFLKHYSTYKGIFIITVAICNRHSSRKYKEQKLISKI